MKKLALDQNDILFYAGLIALFVGLWIMYGLGMALAVCGAILCGTGLVNSFILVWLSRHAA